MFNRDTNNAGMRQGKTNIFSGLVYDITGAMKFAICDDNDDDDITGAAYQSGG